MFGSVSGRRDAPDLELADVDHIAIRVRRMRIREGGIGAGMHRDRTKLRERTRARDVVVVDVRLERVGDENAEASGR